MTKKFIALSVIAFLMLSGCTRIFGEPESKPDPAAVEQYNRTQSGNVDDSLKNLPRTEDFTPISAEESEKAAKEKEEAEQKEYDELVQKTFAFDQPVTFSGPASGIENFCLATCDTCSTEGTMTITLLPDMTMQIGYATDCMVFGMEGCQASDKCMHVITGGYNKEYGNMVFSTCSGASSVSGKGSFNETSSSGVVSCIHDGEIIREFTWDNLPKIN